jgi:serine/threonine protein kinase
MSEDIDKEDETPTEVEHDSKDTDVNIDGITTTSNGGYILEGNTGSLEEKARKYAEIKVLETNFGDIEVVDNLKTSDMYHVSHVRLEENGKIQDRVLKILRKPKEIPAKDYNIFFKRFMREAAHGEHLSSNNNSFITVVDFGFFSDVPYILMEYAAGGSLKDKIVQAKNGEQTFDGYDILGWANYSARALNVAHNHNFIHRDMKPENVLITKRGQVRIADLGLVRPMRLWGYGLEKKFIGTPFYASPEQFEGNPKAIDSRTDIYSLGLVIYELLTGVNPLNPKRTKLKGLDREAVFAFLKGNAQREVSIGELAPDMSDGLVKTIDKCLKSDREERYSSFKGFITDLKKTEEYQAYYSPK